MKITPCDLEKGIAYDNPFKKNKIHPFDKIGRCIRKIRVTRNSIT